MPKACEEPPRGITTEGEKALVIDNSYDPMWERLLSVNPYVTPESLTKILEMAVDAKMFDEAEAQCNVRKIDGRKEASSPVVTDGKNDIDCCVNDLT